MHGLTIIKPTYDINRWTTIELEELDRKTRKLMTMYGTQHPKADVDGQYLQRCEGGRGLIGLEDCVQVEVHILEKYLSTFKEKKLKEVSRSRINENNTYGRNLKRNIKPNGNF